MNSRYNRKLRGTIHNTWLSKNEKQENVIDLKDKG